MNLRWLFPPLCALFLSAAGAAAQPTVGPASRAEAVKIVADLREIVTPNGIERLEKIRIGGIDQWVSVRSHDRRNPVLLVLHGGPGWVAMPHAWHSARGWEEYFTVVQWDQRGAGKTYVANDPAKVAPTMNIDRMVSDTEEVIEWTRRELGKDKIVLLGHSWGSILGLRVAERHPEWLHAYVGVAQGIDVAESERRGWRWAMDRAIATSNMQAAQELQSIAPYATDDRPIPDEHLLLQRKWLNVFGGAVYRRPDASFEAASAHLAPEYTDEDLRNMEEAQAFSVKFLLPDVLKTDLSQIRRIGTPLVLFLGRHDVNLSSSVAAEWFERLEAPFKKLVWFENSAHEMLSEEPGKALVSLVAHVRPIADRAGDGGAR